MGELKDILINLGAIAGVASIIGLAVLAMLYFSQARDVRRLREWAGREPERAAEVELRAAQIASQAIAQAYESMAMRQSEAVAAAQIAEEQGVVVEAPLEAIEHAVEPVVAGMEGAVDDPAHEELLAAEAAAGIENGVIAVDEPRIAAVAGDTASELDEIAAAANAADTTAGDEHPEPVVSGMEGAADDPEHLAELAAAEAAAVPAGESTGSFVPDATGNGQAATGDVPAVPPSLTPPGEAAPATGEVRPSRLAPSTPAAARGQIPLPPLPPLDTSEFLAVNRPTPVASDFYSSTESTGAGHYETVSGGRPPEPRGSRTPFVVAGILVAVFALVLIATQLTGDDEPGKNDPSAQRQARDKRTTSTSPRNPRINRPAVTVTVLNGTQTAGLARIASEQLVQAGFTETTSGNRNDNIDHIESVVFYAEGSKLEAEEVARELTIKSVKKIDEDTQAAGGSVPVVVVLGADFEQ